MARRTYRPRDDRRQSVPQRPAPLPILTAETTAALAILEGQSDPVVFLTGRAGTGKSTLLQYYRATTTKRLVVLAPTGIAAVNVGGQTIHAFCGFGPDITVEKARQLRRRERSLVQRLDTIVIDEISMTRCDLLDCLDAFLRVHGRAPGHPFGGIQMVFVGDLYQLPPVVLPADAPRFRRPHVAYPSPYFFDAQVFRTCPIRVVELTHVFRQRDPVFVTLLEAIRTGSIDAAQLERVNTRVQHPSWPAGAAPVHLVPTNAQAEQINAVHLAQLPTPAVTFQGRRTGTFSPAQASTPAQLTLKVGARVMLLANDAGGKFVNGDIGIITAITADTPEAAITVHLEHGYHGVVRPYTWEVLRFVYDPRQDRIATTVVGTFTQYPLRLAWALTIHKAQGQTFDQVLIDFGRGTFAHGQAYVALSRCTSLEGLVLQTPLHPRHFCIDRRVSAFLAAAGRQPESVPSIAPGSG